MSRRIDRRTFLLASATGAGAYVLSDRVLKWGESSSVFDRSRITGVERSWSRIEAWMRAHAPEALEVLHPGASDDAIRAAEKALGRQLPESYRRSVARHDGQQQRWPSLIEFGFLMPLQDVVTRSRELEKWLEETPGDTRWWRRGWVPFVSRDGDYLSLDLAPRDDAGHGRVWCFLHDDEPMHSVVASSYRAWLTRWADELEAGVFALDRAAGAGLLPRQPSVRSRLWPN